MTSEEEFRSMVEWYETHKEELLDKYEGQWVAIIPDENGQYGVRDNDTDKLAMVRRVQKEYAGKPIVIQPVEKEELTVRIRPRPRFIMR
jgi:hypothetical protein